jgi:hypothetical protein
MVIVPRVVERTWWDTTVGSVGLSYCRLEIAWSTIILHHHVDNSPLEGFGHCEFLSRVMVIVPRVV